MHISQRTTRRRSRIGVALGLASLMLVAACSSSSGDDEAIEASGEGGGAQAGAEAAKALVDEYRTRPESVEFDVPVGAEIPAGKTVAYITCGTETCEQKSSVLKQATDILDWNLEVLSTDGSPQQTANAWETVVRTKPDGVFYIGTPRSAIDKYIRQAKENGTVVTACCITDPIEDGIDWAMSTPSDLGILGKVMAGWVVNEAVEDGVDYPTVVYVGLPDFDILTSLAENFRKSWIEMCPGCGYDTLDFGLSDLGDANDAIVSYLRSNPDTKYVVLSADSPFVGLPAALKAAGLEGIKLLGEGPSSANIELVRNGEEAATLGTPEYEIEFGAVDAIARAVSGVPIEPGFPTPTWILDAETIPDEPEPFKYAPDVVEHFKELWGKS